MSGIRAVCFDVAGVLTRPVGPAFLIRAGAAGIEPSDLRAALWATFSAEGDADLPAHRLERGEIALDEFIDLTGAVGETVRTLLDPESAHFVPSAFERHHGMHDFVREVRAKGLKTAMISNAVREWAPWWAAVVPPLDLFDEVVYSYEVGMRKPNPAIYRYTLDHLGVEPHETLYMDDFPAMVASARAVGMIAIHVEDHEAAISEARALVDG